MSSRFDFARALEKLSSREPLRIESPKRAAVAAFIRGQGAAAEVLLMRRSRSDNDRWSGQVCLPGGMTEEEDADSVATAHRETLEELGFDLHSCGAYVGALDDVQAVAKGRALPMVITPTVFTQTVAPKLVLNEEADRAFWMPLAPASSGDLDDRYEYGVGASKLYLPCWRYDGEVVWGLTYKMLLSLLVLAADGE